jgi:hypothetical protein
MTDEDPEEHDHDLDYPWTLYFNGEPMPRWSNCWSLCDLLKHAIKSCEEHSCAESHADFSLLMDRMDPAHTVESEDGDRFRICCLTLLVLLLRHKSAVLEKLALFDPDDSSIAEDIYAGVRDGLIAMHALTLRDGIAFWSVGYDSDFERLTEAIRRSQLPSSHPDYLEPPHLRAKREEVTSRLRDLRCSLLEIVKTDHLSKDLRRFIHELPTKI